MRYIEIKKASQNNLKNIDLKIPLESLTVVCGLSGSGKSSLAFETLYAEGQRRYLENLSNYIKQYIVQQKHPKVESITHIPPALALEQKNNVRSSRSTVATLSGLSDHLRLIFENLAQPFCPEHNKALQSFSPSTAADYLLKHHLDSRGYLIVPVVSKRIKDSKTFLKELHHSGFSRLLVPQGKTLSKGKIKSLEEIKKLPTEDFYILVDRLVINQKEKTRLADSLNQSFQISKLFSEEFFAIKEQSLFVSLEGTPSYFSKKQACPECFFQMNSKINHALFSFNSPLGACKNCQGYGSILEMDIKKIIPNPKMSLKQGAIKPLSTASSYKYRKQLKEYCAKVKIPWDKAWDQLTQKQQQQVWESPKGLKAYFKYLEGRRHKMHVRVLLSRFRSHFLCKNCNGTRLNKDVQQIFLNGKTYIDYLKMTLGEIKKHFDQIPFSKEQIAKCQESIEAFKNNINYLNAVGLSYLTLDRAINTLSGGEFQRLNLANQLGLRLSQVLYVLDEPTVGLHPRDTKQIINLLKDLKDLGNTIVVVEHDPDMIESSDYIVEMGPHSGRHGGKVVWSGLKSKFLSADKSNTASYLNRKSLILKEPREVKKDNHKYALFLEKASGHNLKNVNLFIPLNRLVVVTGVSGSGKSSLISETLYPALSKALHYNHSIESLPYRKLSGDEFLNDVVLMNQSDIQGNRRSFIASYFKCYDTIRLLFANTKLAQKESLKSSHFSLNVEGGRCPSCVGLGYQEIDMVFMDPIQVVCEDCDGKKFKKEILDIKYEGKNIYELMNLTIEESSEFFKMEPKLLKVFMALKSVGLSYLTLGQSISSLSGGEKQRLKLAKEILNADQEKTLYILDEPTKGLHFEEIGLLMKVLNKLIESGASVLVIEHNLEVIKEADYIIDVGPEAGEFGGKIIAEGNVKKIIKNRKSHTAEFLKQYLSKYQVKI